MCVQHKWPSANINNRHGKYTVCDDDTHPSSLFRCLPFLSNPRCPWIHLGNHPLPRADREGSFARIPAAPPHTYRARTYVYVRGPIRGRCNVMEPLSLDNFIIGHWRRPFKRANSLPPRSTDTKRFSKRLDSRGGGGGEGREEEGALSMMGIVLSSSFLWVFSRTDIMAHIENST